VTNGWGVYVTEYLTDSTDIKVSYILIITTSFFQGYNTYKQLRIYPTDTIKQYVMYSRMSGQYYRVIRYEILK